MGRSKFALAVVAVTMAVQLLPSPSKAADVYYIYGTVTDTLGNELSGVTVRNGGQVTTTDEDGFYQLGQGSVGTFTISASRHDLATATATVDILVPQDTQVDFRMLYAHDLSLAPNLVSAAGGDISIAAAVTGTAPNPADTCVWLRHNDEVSALTPGVDLGAAAWTGEVLVPQGTSEGFHRVEHWATECSTGQNLTWVGHANYLVDNTAPRATAHAPTGWTRPDVILRVRAADLVGFSFAHSEVSVDGNPVGGEWAGSDRDAWFSASLDGLEPGLHTARARIVDYASNTTEIEWQFTVDPQAPSLTDPTPAGIISDSSPTLGIRAFDGVSGVNPSSIRMSIHRGPLQDQVEAEFDAASGLITYEVPAMPEGTGLGDAPLLDGEYTIVVTVADNAGWSTSESWTIDVRNLLPPTHA